MAKLRMATFTDTPTPTMVVTPRLRRIGSRSVPPIGPSPWSRLSTMSESATPISGTTCTAGVPGRRGTGVLSMPMNSRALWLEPWPSSRRMARQWTTATPAARAPAARRAMLGTAVRCAASASWGRAASGPMVAPWHSWVTRAVCPAATSSRQIQAHGDSAGGAGCEAAPGRRTARGSPTRRRARWRRTAGGG